MAGSSSRRLLNDQGYRLPEHRKRLTRALRAGVGSASLLGIICVTTVATTIVPASASLSCLGYSGVSQQSISNYLGIEGYVNNATMSVQDNSFDHAISWLGSTDHADTTHCTGDPSRGANGCWIQAGDGTGDVTTAKTTDGVVEAYMEENGANGYDPSFYPSLTIAPPGGTDFFTVFNTLTTNRNGNEQLWDAYMKYGSTLTPIGSSYFLLDDGGVDLQSVAQAEAYVGDPNDTSCPSFDKYQTFGMTGSGTVTGGSQVSLYLPSETWAAWTNTRDGSRNPLDPGSLYHYTTVDAYYAWTMYGDGTG